VRRERGGGETNINEHLLELVISAPRCDSILLNVIREETIPLLVLLFFELQFSLTISAEVK
jgi:hypothetical protein